MDIGFDEPETGTVCLREVPNMIKGVQVDHHILFSFTIFTRGNIFSDFAFLSDGSTIKGLLLKNLLPEEQILLRIDPLRREAK